MQMLLRELSFEKQQALAALENHPGFIVLQELVQDACQQATAEVIRLDPAGENYTQKLSSLQARARAINDFSTALLKSISVHSDAVSQSVSEEENQ